MKVYEGTSTARLLSPIPLCRICVFYTFFSVFFFRCRSPLANFIKATAPEIEMMKVLLLAAALYRGVTLIETVAEFASGFTLITPESVLPGSTELGAELSSLQY